MNWHSTIIDTSPTMRATRHAIVSPDGPLSFGQALELLAGEPPDFARFLTRLLASAPPTAYRWETPPITRASIERRFEFAVVDDPFLDMTPEPEVFAGYFAGCDDAALAVPNRGGTATLVVPRELAETSAYVHIAAFLRRAPESQIVAWWRCVARATLDALDDRPLWLSTAGGGVAWLHARIERVPKYYAYRPYARMPG